jgi:hypothetical protein
LSKRVVRGVESEVVFHRRRVGTTRVTKAPVAIREIARGGGIDATSRRGHLVDKMHAKYMRPRNRESQFEHA